MKPPFFQLNFGTAPLPRDLDTLESAQKSGRCSDRASTRCTLCGELFGDGADDVSDGDALRRHIMSTHVPQKFMRYSCGRCDQRFLLSDMLEEHEAAGDCDDRGKNKSVDQEKNRSRG